MNIERLNLVFISIFAGVAILFAPSTGAREAVLLAQEPPAAAQQFSQPVTAPAPAPSLLKQAGGKLLENAQKKVLHEMNLKLQMQSPPQFQQQLPGTFQSPGNAGATTFGGSLAPPARKQAAPCRSWVLPGEKPIACLLCIHGLGLQSNSYEYFGKEQSNHGLAVYALDVRGFGSWINANGKTKVDFNECLDDVKQALESIRAANPGLPVYLLGESMGGAIALRAASMYPNLVDGLISSVPASERFNQGKTSMKVFLNLLAGSNIADVGKDIVNQATNNAKLKAQWQEDPLSRLNLSPQELIQFQDFMNNNHEAARKVVDMPVLFVQGTGDHLVKPEGTWELFNTVAARDKSFLAVPGEHLIFEEAQTQEPAQRDQNFRVISAWLSTKVGRRFRGTNGSVARAAGMSSSLTFTPPQEVERQAQMIDNGQYTQAIAELEQLLSARPEDPAVLELMARAYFKNGQPDRAAFFFRKAMRMNRAGGRFARDLNTNLLEMNHNAQSMPTSGGTGQPGFIQPSGSGFGRRFDQMKATTAPSNPAGSSMTPFSANKAKVYAFYANWADQCNSMREMLGRLYMLYGSSVDITLVNIEDAYSDSLMDQFNVGPIPTVVFVAQNGRVHSTIIGESTYTNYEQAIKQLILR